MKRFILLLLASVLLLTLAACGGDKAPDVSASPAAETSTPTTDAPESAKPSESVEPSQPADSAEPSQPSESAAPATAAPTPVATPTPVASGITGLGMTADAFIEAYNSHRTGLGKYELKLVRRESEEMELGGWNIVPISIEVEGESIHSLKLYCDAQGQIAQIDLLCSAPGAATGSDIKGLDGDKATTQSIERLVDVLGGSSGKVMGSISSLTGEYAFSQGDFEYTYWGMNGMAMLQIYTAETGNLDG